VPHTLDFSYIFDADVLIDYRDSDLTIVARFADYAKGCYIGRSAFGEVKRLTLTQANRLNIEILTPDLEIVSESARLKGKLSAYDWETYFLAKKNNLTCVSNDMGLRRVCVTSGVPVMWGLQLMKVLVHAEMLPASQAIRVARKIGESNQRIKAEIIAMFERQVLDIARSL